MIVSCGGAYSLTHIYKPGTTQCCHEEHVVKINSLIDKKNNGNVVFCSKKLRMTVQKHKYFSTLTFPIIVADK